MKIVLYVVIFVAVLYVIKVPSVVLTVNQNIQVAITVWNYVFDVAINLRERHPYAFISLFFILVATLIPSKHYAKS